MRRGFVAIVLTAIVSVFVAAPAGADSRIGVAPGASFTLTEGASQVVQLELQEPIIAPSPDPVVDLTLTPSDPDRVSLTGATVEWAETEWAQARTFTVEALHDGIHNPSNTITLQGVMSSASEYYSGYHVTITVTLTDIDPAPSTTTMSTTTTSTTTSALPSTTVVAGATLPATGRSTSTTTAFAMLCVVVGSGCLATRRRLGRAN